MTKTRNVELRNVKKLWQDPAVNAILDGGADTSLLGRSFLMLSYTERKVNVSGFDEGIVFINLPIGTGVTAYDKDDGTTILLLVHKAIDHTSQENSLLSGNQLRNHAVDICETHQNFAVNGRPGKLRMKVDEHIIPFTMKNSLASMYFRHPTEDELEECDVIQLTSDAQ